MELTAAGLYRIYTCFPFNPLPGIREVEPKRCKSSAIFLKLKTG